MKKLIAFILGVLFCYSTFAAGAALLDQKITYSAENKTVKSIIQGISLKYKIPFAYSETVVKVDDKTSLSVSEKPLYQVLDKLFGVEAVNYKEVNGQILLLKKKVIANDAEKYTISGYVREKGSGESLLGVNIYVPGTRFGTTTNNYGFYSITLPGGPTKLTYSYVGYESVNIEFDLKKDELKDVELKPTIELEEVVVTAEELERPSNVVQMSKIEIPVQQVQEIPALLGEKDVMKVLQLMPGVQKGSEGQSGLYVRGGGPDQNLIILDDATVYNAFHLFGFFSLFNGDALKSIELTKGGFPARYGGRLSSVLNMNMKEGNKEKIKGEVGIGILSSRFTLEGPLKKGKSSFLLSGRRTYFDVLARPFMPSDNYGGYYFYDMNAKFNYDFGPKDKLYVSGYFGKDKFYANFSDGFSSSKVSLGWGNVTATTRWNHLINKKMFSNTSLIFSNYKFLISASDKDYVSKDEFTLQFYSQIRDYSVKYDIDYFPNTNHYIKMGAVATQHAFSPSAIVFKNSYTNDDVKAVKRVDGFESAIYIEDDMRFGKRFKANTGFRLSHFNNRNRNYINPEPRLAVAYQIKANLAAKASFAVMNQYIHLLSNTGIGLPTDLWVPSTSNVSPQRSIQYAAGIAKDFPKSNLTLTVEGYYKKMNKIIAYREGASFLGLGSNPSAGDYAWENNITSGQGWSYGSEFLLQRKKGRLTGWIGYTLSWTQLQFDELNFGKKYWARYDRRHDISLVGIYKITDNITISATWVYGTGQAITLPQADYNVINPSPIQVAGSGFNNFLTVTDYGEKNTFRMAPYHRMDIGVRFKKKLSWCERTTEISIYNLYNRKNPYFYYTSNDARGNNVLKQFSLFPIIPSISYSFKF